MRARRQPGPEQMTAGRGARPARLAVTGAGQPERGCGTATRTLERGREGRRSYSRKHRFVYLYVVKLK